MSTGALFRAYLSPIASTRTFFLKKLKIRYRCLLFMQMELTNCARASAL